MANLSLILFIVLLFFSKLHFSAAQLPSTAPTLPPPPQQIQLNNIIDALIGAGDFHDSAITHPDMYTNSQVSVYGIETILDYTLYGGNPFEPRLQTQQTQLPQPQNFASRTSALATLFFSIVCAVLAFDIHISRFNKVMISLFLCALCFGATAHGMSPEEEKACLLAYFEDSAPAAFRTPECSPWVQLVEDLKINTTGKCDLATHQGHRDYQEDRMTCNLDIEMPFLRNYEDKLHVLAIFDGHGGVEASEMANQNLLDYFLLHLILGAYEKSVENLDQPDLNPESPPKVYSSFIDNESFHRILKEALVHAIYDIDYKFSWEAFAKRWHAGSTATVILLLNDEELLVANLGDSPAFLCKRKRLRRKLRAEKLTRNHHPDEKDERARIEAAGGFVRVSGVPRVNGISRAIGDITLKRYGVTAEPEVRGWEKLSSRDRYLVIASDGIFQSLSPNDVCNLIQKGGSSSLSGSIVKAALKSGSTDNLSVIVLPLRQPTSALPKQEL